MKKQNVNNKLAFGKATVTELNENQMFDVNGGTSTITFSTIPCLVAASVVVVAVAIYASNKVE